MFHMALDYHLWCHRNGKSETQFGLPCNDRNAHIKGNQ